MPSSSLRRDSMAVSNDFHWTISLMMAIALICTAIDAAYWADSGDDDSDDEDDI